MTPKKSQNSIYIEPYNKISERISLIFPYKTQLNLKNLAPAALLKSEADPPPPRKSSTASTCVMRKPAST